MCCGNAGAGCAEGCLEKGDQRCMTLKYHLLKDLEPGDRFLLPIMQKRGTLVHISATSATVKYDGQNKVEVKDRMTGKVQASFDAPSKNVSISCETIVVRLVKKMRGEK
jgi:hypothetical protein